MKINLSVDGMEFKNQVKNLRKKLNACQETGILEEGFEEELENLLQTEEKLLAELIPYYRVYANDIKKTSIKISPIKQVGSFGFTSFLQTSLRINENLFITSSIDRKVQFFYIDMSEEPSKHNQLTGEWSPPIKEINETISFLYQLNSKEILLLGVRGGSYILSSDNFDQLPDVNGEIKVKRIQTDYDFNEFCRCYTIGDGLFVAENGEEVLNLFEIVKENKVYRLILHKEVKCTIPNWTTLGKINEDYFAVGTRTGQLYLIKYENRQFTMIEKIDLLDDEIRQIKCLEDENENMNFLIVTGNNGQLKILSFNGNSIDITMGQNDLNGNLFQVQSEKGTQSY